MNRQSRRSSDIHMHPGYAEIYGIPATHEMLLQVLGRFGVRDWLCQLSRIGNLLRESRCLHRDFIERFLAWFTPPELREKVYGFYKEAEKEGRATCIFTDRHAAILSELALIHSPATAPRSMHFPGNEKDVLDAFLLLVGIEAAPGVERGVDPLTDQEVGALYTPLWYRSKFIDLRWQAARGFRLFRILTDRQSRTASRDWANLFEAATACNIDDFFAGGFMVLLQELNRSPDDLATGWTPLQPFGPGARGRGNKCLNAYYSIRCGSVEALAGLVREYEPVESPGDFCLAPLYTSPVVELEDDRKAALFLRGIAVSLCDGIYWSVAKASDQGKTGVTSKHVGGLFGRLYEDYVLETLESGFGNRLLKRPLGKHDANEVADGIILYPSGIILLSLKARHFQRRDHYSYKTAPERLDDLDRAGVSDAISQIADGVARVRKGALGDLGLGNVSELPVQPAVVTYDDVANFPLAEHLLDGVLAAGRVDRYTRKPILMATGDIERIACLSGKHDLWEVTTAYLLDADARRSSFHNYLVAQSAACNDLLDHIATDAWNRIRTHVFRTTQGR